MMRIIFMHLIKTGGSTINKHIYNEMPGKMCNEDSNIHCDLNDCQFYSGHNAFYGIHGGMPGEWKYMTIIRDPADWYASVYNQQMSRDKVVDAPSFDVWYNNPASNSVNVYGGERNRMAIWFNAAFARGVSIKDILDNAWFVGITEYIDRDFPKLCRLMGISENYTRKRVAGKWDDHDNIMIEKRYEVTPEMREKIYIDNPMDVEFYQYALERNRITRPNLEGGI